MRKNFFGRISDRAWQKLNKFSQSLRLVELLLITNLSFFCIKRPSKPVVLDNWLINFRSLFSKTWCDTISKVSWRITSPPMLFTGFWFKSLYSLAFIEKMSNQKQQLEACCFLVFIFCPFFCGFFF